MSYSDQIHTAKQAYLLKLKEMMANLNPFDSGAEYGAYRVQSGIEKFRGACWLKPAGIQELIETPKVYSEKCKVLNRMRLFPAALCAAYLGTTSNALHSLHRESCGVFAEQYKGNLCFSYEEMCVLMKNSEWFFYASDRDQKPNLIALESFLCDGAFVGRTIAFAFLGDQRLAVSTGPYHRPFRLSEIKRAFLAAIEEKQFVCH